MNMIGVAKPRTNDGGLSLVLDEAQKDQVKTFAMDRQAQRGLRRDEIVSVKVRPVICKDLTIFGTPRSQQRRNRSRSRKFDENLNIGNTHFSLARSRSKSLKSLRGDAKSVERDDRSAVKSAKSARSGKSAKSGRSSKSARSARKDPIVDREKTLKSKKKRTVRKKVRKPVRSVDSDEVFERLHTSY